VLYLNGEYKAIFKILPYSLKQQLGTLVQGPGGRGADVTNPYYAEKWKLLKEYWQELFEFAEKCKG